MARKPDLDRRAAIAAQALEHIRAHGIHGVTMRSIARAVGMKRPTLYWYYRDLGGIFEAVLEGALAEQESFFMGRLEGLDHPIDVLEAYLEASLEFGRGRRELIIALFQLWALARAGDPQGAIQRARRLAATFREILVAGLRTGVEEGAVKECDPEAVVDLVLAVCDGIGVGRVARLHDSEAAARLVIDGVLEPLRVKRVRRATLSKNGVRRKR